MRGLAGKVAIVTGTTKSMGSAIARRLCAEGATVIGCGRTVAGGQANADALVAEGYAASFLRADVGVESDVEAVVKAAIDTYGRLDIVVNNAAPTDVIKTGHEHGVLGESSESFETMLRVGLIGPFYFFKHAGAVLTDGGAFVSISSNTGSRSMPGMPGYAAAKAGLEGLSRAAAADLAARNIRSNVISLGFVSNPENAYALTDPVLGPALRKLQILPYMAVPEDVASMVAYLASDETKYVNATVVSLDGGASVKAPLPEVDHSH
jgi:NAD(P)-dependent dehydrogenase (short-subunit alcohol dehydrogenase family)